jgi:hypothetical protein
MSPGLQKQTKTTHVQQTERSGVRHGLQVHRITGKTARLDVPVWRAGNYWIIVHDMSTEDEYARALARGIASSPVKLERHLKVEPQVH